MNRKQVLVLSLSALISLGGMVNGGAAFAAQPNNSDFKFEAGTASVIQFENLSFEDFMKDMNTKKIPKEDMTKLKNLYEEMQKLEKNEKFDEADKKQVEFDKILDKYIKPLSFEDFMKDMPTKKISKDDMTKLKSLYTEIQKLEKSDKFDDADKKWKEFDKILDKYIDKDIEMKPISFEDFMKDMTTKKISKDDMTKLKSFYKEIQKLEKNEKFDDADKKWDEFYKILDKYMDKDIEMKPVSFEDFMKDTTTKKIPKEDMAKLKSFYAEIQKLEKNDKFDDADKKWDEFYKILDKYIDDNEEGKK